MITEREKYLMEVAIRLNNCHIDLTEWLDLAVIGIEGVYSITNGELLSVNADRYIELKNSGDKGDL